VTGLIFDVINNFHYLAGKYRDLPAMILLPCFALAAPFMARRIGWAARPLQAAALVVATVIAAIMLWASSSYLTNTGYLDHIESSIAAVSWWYHQGHPLYPGWSDNEGLYGLQYGPLLFQLTAAALSLGPSILISKLPGYCCFWLACIVVMWSLRPLLPSGRQALLPMAALVIMAGCYWRAAYWVRSEPYLVLFAALALCSYLRLGRTAAAVALGVLGGCAINMKIHGALYILPYAVALLASPQPASAGLASRPASAGSDSDRLRIAAIGIASGSVAVAIPFLLPNVSLLHYIAFLQATLQHGFARSLLVLNLRFGAVLAMPALLLVWRRRRGGPQPDLPMALTYLVSVLIVCLIGAKNGAGPTHLLPFLPAFVFFMAKAAQTIRIPGSTNEARAAALAACFLVVMVAYIPAFAANLSGLRDWDRIVDNPAFRREAIQLYKAYPTAIMGSGDDASYSLTEYKVFGVFAGGPLTFDPSTWMDLQKGGVPETFADQLLIGCRSPVWIIPKGGAPFTKTSPYDPDPMFSDQFRALFHQQYTMVRDGTNYTVWACRKIPSGSPEPQDHAQRDHG
jgi:hypothetical protein